MNESDIRTYAALMAELNLTGLEITENDRVVRLERSPLPSPAPAPAPSRGEAVQVMAPQPVEVREGSYVTSPMVGVFYTSPAEDAEPFVKVGDQVKKGQPLCILEAMKLMNEIMAEEDGEILEILAENGQVVDYGCRLFRVRRQA